MADQITIERVQLGVKMEKRMVKVLKALAEAQDMTLGELLEDIVLHAFEGVSTFGNTESEDIKALKKVYQMDYGVHDSQKFSSEG
ncbi:hypothetical protein [Deinococcus cellulosilyticus]|uniref:Uncharacterized protein n=1 Tax=Deinococcus cellulosilyticus (strain DSM 18568 / NBRC 106333 / KACC 11606 / 5516J-15) TaxID=1223518 RepID=A0A511MXS6_DEIC1|nr:hypothetical protein [Deinococcus cellulosilyticus]GEM45392.1 hypothetical protein DC3_10270 [Deinococcus cellulosilyticus NBRC 106333 = KACC 11606]